MSKYTPLWQYLTSQPGNSVTLTFDEIAKITGFKFNHAFLTCKKELPEYGWQFDRLSLKEQWVSFKRC